MLNIKNIYRINALLSNQKLNRLISKGWMNFNNQNKKEISDNLKSEASLQLYLILKNCLVVGNSKLLFLDRSVTITELQR